MASCRLVLFRRLCISLCAIKVTVKPNVKIAYIVHTRWQVRRLVPFRHLCICPWFIVEYELCSVVGYERSRSCLSVFWPIQMSSALSRQSMKTTTSGHVCIVAPCPPCRICKRHWALVRCASRCLLYPPCCSDDVPIPVSLPRQPLLLFAHHRHRASNPLSQLPM